MSRSRVELLSDRVSWLDRHRRSVAILCAALSAPLMISQIDSILGVDWPKVHALALSLMAGAILWIVIEIGLVWLTALWETECTRLQRDNGLPQARVRRRTTPRASEK